MAYTVEGRRAMRLRLLAAGLAAAALAGGCENPTATIDVEPPAPFSLQQAYSFDGLPAGDFVHRFGFQSTGTLWATTFRGTILRVEDGQRTSFDAEAVVGDGQLRDLFIDRADRVWVTAGQSLAVFEGGAWSVQTPTDLFGLAPVAGQVAVNASGDVLLGMGNANSGGLLLRRGGRWRAITPDNSRLPSPIVSSIEVAPNGAFWVGSHQFQGRGGLSLIEGDRVVTVVDTDNGLLYNWSDDLAATGSGVFAGFAVPIYNNPAVVEGGIQEISVGGRIPQGRVINSWSPFSSGLTSNRVTSLTYTSSGELWFTTSGPESGCPTCTPGVGVLNRSNQFQIRSAQNAELDANEYLPDIAEGPDGAIYVLRADKDLIMRVVR